MLDDLPLEDIEQLFIQKALARHGGDVRRAAAHLGLSRSALYRRLQPKASVQRTAMTTSERNGREVQPSIEQSVLVLGLLAGLPASALVLYGVWAEPYTFEVRWTITSVIICVWVGAAAAARQMVTRVLFVAANLLGALREGDYSIRGVGARPGSAAGLVMTEINALGQTLQRQRTEAVESTALLSSVMQAIDVAMFAFDTEERLVLVNPAAERLLGRVVAEAAGRRAAELRLDPYLSGPVPRLVDRASPDTARSKSAARPSIATASRTSSSRFPTSAARCASRSKSRGSASSACCRTRSTTR